jgi:hypothetical protein
MSSKLIRPARVRIFTLADSRLPSVSVGNDQHCRTASSSDALRAF